VDFSSSKEQIAFRDSLRDYQTIRELIQAAFEKEVEAGWLHTWLSPFARS
jgi:hypothetical protein